MPRITPSTPMGCLVSASIAQATPSPPPSAVEGEEAVELANADDDEDDEEGGTGRLTDRPPGSGAAPEEDDDDD
jgi:hypothetical protein